MSRAPILTSVVRFLTDRPNQIVYLDQLVEATGFTAQQVRAALSNARAAQSPAVRDVEFVISGSAWSYRAETRVSPTAAPIETTTIARHTDNGQVDDDKVTFEIVGHTSGGVALVREVDRPTGPIYRLVEVQ